MRFLTILITYTCITSILIYTNIIFNTIVQESQTYRYLLGIILLGLFIVVSILPKRIFIRRSLIFLVIFYIYFLLKTAIDVPDPTKTLRSYTLGTSGGTLIFYLVGFMTGVGLRHSFIITFFSRTAFKFNVLIFTAYLVITNFILLNIYLSFSNFLRSDIFLISNIFGNYQTSGDMLIINFLITSFAIFLMLLRFFVKKTLFQSGMWLFTIPYSVTAIISSLISLSIGSNKATICILLVWSLTLLLSIITQNLKIRKFLQTNLSQLSIKRWFNLTVLGRVLLAPILTLIFVGLVIYSVIVYLNFDLEKTRLFNFGEGGTNTSLTSRMEILEDNFFIHWSYSPIFGHMNVDVETTGVGTYVHSLPTYLLTHTGIIGFTMFFLYIFVATKELLYSSINELREYPLFISNALKIYSFIIIVSLLSFASFSVTLTWIPLWFIMGLIFTPMVFIPGKNSGLKLRDQRR